MPGSSTPPRAPAVSAPPVKRSAPRKWTSPAELRPAILSALQDAEGELDGDEVFVHLEVRIGDQLRPGDREANPQGELRWRAAARKARKSLMDDGLLEAAPGVWRLSELGRSADLPEA
ncbi:hypothetical protein [Nocardioides sp. W7]|uniref:hypothetical protein n=1 Tax=Nocardioides sp. W7 TaxID=2931390 RepID=UPI001FD21AAD|nr:hypothetical protein [Nocardioides sp. W7]